MRTQRGPGGWRTRVLVAAVIMLGTAAGVAPTRADPPPDYLSRVQAAVDELAMEMGAEQTQVFTAALAAGGEKPHAGLGALSFLGQHLERAAWLYGKGVLAEPGNDLYLNNFGLCLHEKALLKPAADKGTPARFLTLARESLEQAVALKGDAPLYQNNLGVALLEIWRASGDPATLDAAVAALQRATTLNPKSAAAWAHLAEALAAKGDVPGAANALSKSRALGAFNGALLSAKSRVTQPVLNAFKKQTPPCKVDYRCKANCPKSIIGQVTLVTCEISQANAQSACEEGKPYAAGFDCAEQVPKFGILIPGLNSGFSLITPWGRADVLVDGAGNVTYRCKPSTSVAGLSVSLEARGNWTPASGLTVAEVSPGVSYNLMGGDAAKLMNDAKMGPASVAIEGSSKTGTVELKVKAYGGTVFSH